MTPSPTDSANPTGAPIRVGVVDDQLLVRAGFRMVLDSQPDITVVAEASDGREAVAIFASGAVDVVLMDVRMPVMDGIEATAALVRAWQERASAARIAVLTTFDLDEYALAAIRAGASGFLLKDAPPDQLLAAVRTVHRGDAVIAPSTTRRLLEHLITQEAAGSPQADPAAGDRARLLEAINTLTERERDVLALMARGLTNEEIATTLFVAESTVKTHVGHILAKLDARDRVQAVVTAFEAGLVRPNDPRAPH